MQGGALRLSAALCRGGRPRRLCRPAAQRGLLASPGALVPGAGWVPGGGGARADVWVHACWGRERVCGCVLGGRGVPGARRPPPPRPPPPPPHPPPLLAERPSGRARGGGSASASAPQQQEASSSDDLLVRALLMHPWAVVRLQARLREQGVARDERWASALRRPLFAQATDGGSATLAHLVDLFVERQHLIWKVGGWRLPGWTAPLPASPHSASGGQALRLGAGAARS